MLFIAKFTLEKTLYMVDTPERTEVTQLVDADSVEQAEKKVTEHYNKQSVDYSVYYSVRELVVVPTIL